MKATVKRIIPKERCITYLLDVGDGVYATTYTGAQYRNYTNWRGLKIGDEIGGLKWKDESKKIIDGDSKVEIYERGGDKEDDVSRPPGQAEHQEQRQLQGSSEMENDKGEENQGGLFKSSTTDKGVVDISKYRA